MISDEYVAGLFDGEGSVTVARYINRHKLSICITQKPHLLLLLVQEQFGGSIYFNTTASFLRFEKKKDIDRFLERITPLVILKRTQLELAQAFRRTVRYSGNKLSEEEFEEREWFKQEITRLNRGVEE